MVEEAYIRMIAESDPGRKAELEAELRKAMTRMASAIVFKKLNVARPELVDSVVNRALQKLPSFRGDSKFTTWFTAILNNSLFDALREKQNSRKFVPVEKAPELSQNPEGANNAKRLLEELCEQLTPREREWVAMLREGATIEEVAEHFGISVGGAKSLWWRLKAKMRKISRYSVARTASRTSGVRV